MIGYGSGFNGSKKVEERKKRLFEIIKPYEEKLFELIDTEEKICRFERYTSFICRTAVFWEMGIAKI